MVADPAADVVAALRARVTALEAERRRAFEDAQREADALFAQYQLSQLLASGGPLGELATAVGLELVRLAAAAGGGLWLDDGEGSAVERVALVGAAPTGVAVPHVASSFADLDAARAWAAGITSARAIILSEAAPRTLLVVWPPAGANLDDDGLRVAQLARHELAVAFAGARLREAFEREREDLEAIVDGATDCILQVDGEGAVVRLNPAGERLLGIDAAGALGRTCATVLGCEAAGGHGPDDCPLAEVRASADPIAYRETMIRGAAGANVHVAGSYAASPGTSDATARATAILRDISAVKALDDLREGFVATVSHELRTPLALIRGYAETLLHLPLDAAQQRAYVERIDEASGRLTAIVDQVLDVTHLQADPLILERSRASFASLVARLRGDLAIAGGLDRLVAAPSDELPTLEVDVARVGQVLSNLVGNALKYAPDGSAVVIGATLVEDGAWVAVHVDDEGVGIPETERGLVMEPFHRAWNVRESRIPGTGLGLFICRRLVEAHGGRLWIDDRPDGAVGTRVGFTLPVAATTALPPRGSAPETDRG